MHALVAGGGELAGLRAICVQDSLVASVQNRHVLLLRVDLHGVVFVRAADPLILNRKRQDVAAVVT